MNFNPTTTPGAVRDPVSTLEAHEIPAAASQSSFPLDSTVAVPTFPTALTPANLTTFIVAQSKRRRGN